MLSKLTHSVRNVFIDQTPTHINLGFRCILQLESFSGELNVNKPGVCSTKRLKFLVCYWEEHCLGDFGSNSRPYQPLLSDGGTTSLGLFPFVL